MNNPSSSGLLGSGIRRYICASRQGTGILGAATAAGMTPAAVRCTLSMMPGTRKCTCPVTGSTGPRPGCIRHRPLFITNTAGITASPRKKSMSGKDTTRITTITAVATGRDNSFKGSGNTRLHPQVAAALVSLTSPPPPIRPQPLSLFSQPGTHPVPAKSAIS